MFLAPARVLEVLPPRSRKKERRIASHRVSPPTTVRPSCPLTAAASSTSFTYVSGVEPTREHQFFNAPSDVCLPLFFSVFLSSFFLPVSLFSFESLRPWDFLGHGSVIWCPTDDRSLLPRSSYGRPSCIYRGRSFAH